MNIQLATNCAESGFELNELALSHGECFECELVVRAEGFVGRVKFWPERFVLQRFLSELRPMHETLQGEALLQSLFEPEHVRMTLNRAGSLVVSGELGQKHANFLRFTFRTDQTVLSPLIRDLELALSTPDSSKRIP